MTVEYKENKIQNAQVRESYGVKKWVDTMTDESFQPYFANIERMEWRREGLIKDIRGRVHAKSHTGLTVK